MPYTCRDRDTDPGSWLVVQIQDGASKQDFTIDMWLNRNVEIVTLVSV